MSETSPLDQYPNLQIAQIRERYSAQRKSEDLDKLISEIRENQMGPFYQQLCSNFEIQPDQSLIDEYEKANRQSHEELQKALEDAQTLQSEEDVRVAFQNLALFFLKIGDWDEAKKYLESLYSKTVALGQKIDVVFCQMRLAFWINDLGIFKELLDQARKLITKGGDWERKNRLKVYEGLYLCTQRKFIEASELFISTLSTFTATELLSYEDFIYRVVLLSVLSLSRAEFGKRIDHAMEVRAADESVHELLSLYHLNYSQFFDALAKAQERLSCDIWFAQHLSYLIKELRVKAYSQFLEPYEALQIIAMAQAFQVTPDFIESEMRRFIFGRKLNAKIDRVTGTIHTNPPDSRSDKMREALKKGEALVTRLQKLGRLLSA